MIRPLGAVAVELVVDELGAVVRVDAGEREREVGLGGLQGLEDPPLGLVLHRAYLRPARGHIGHVQALAEVPGRVPALVAHEVDLEEPRAVLVPLGERADRDLVLEHRAGLGARSPFQLEASAGSLQPPVDGGRRHGKQQLALPWPQLELPEPLQDPHDLFHERGQALAAGAVERGPHLGKRGRQLRPVDEHPPPRLPWLRPTGRLPERAACVIAVPSRERTQLIGDPSLPLLGRPQVPHQRLLGHGLALHHGEPHRVPPSPPFRWGTGSPVRGHPSVRQRSAFAGISRESTRVLDRLRRPRASSPNMFDRSFNLDANVAGP